MWFGSVFLRTLRSYRIAIAGWGLGMALLLLEPLAGASTIVGTAQGRASLTELATSFAWNADPVAVGTATGYAMFKIGIGILLIVIWPLLAASRTLRGEEERGSLDVLLSVPRGRVRVALEKVAAIGAALLAMGVVIGLIVFAGSRPFDSRFGLGDALLFGLNLSLICAVFAGLTLLVSQFTMERRRAAGLSGGLLMVFVVMDMAHRITPGAEWISRLSPIYYYNLSKPLLPGYGMSWGAVLVLVALTVVLTAAALWLFARRDLGSTVPLPGWLRLPERAPQRAAALPVDDWSLRSVYARGLATVALPAVLWTIGIAGFAAWMVAATRQLEHTLEGVYSSSAALASAVSKVGGGDVRTNATLLSAIFILLALLLMGFAVTQVNRWSSDEEEGRLELLLSTPRSRIRVLLGRFAALATATAAIGVITLAASAVAAAAVGLQLDWGNLAAATLGMIPLALLVAAIGYLGSGWLRTAADTGLLSLLLAAWFLISFVGPELQWPELALRLSVFYYYGTPLLHGLQATSMLGVIAVGALTLAAGAWRFASKDIGR